MSLITLENLQNLNGKIFDLSDEKQVQEFRDLEDDFHNKKLDKVLRNGGYTHFVLNHHVYGYQVVPKDTLPFMDVLTYNTDCGGLEEVYVYRSWCASYDVTNYNYEFDLHKIRHETMVFASEKPVRRIELTPPQVTRLDTLIAVQNKINRLKLELSAEFTFIPTSKCSKC